MNSQDYFSNDSFINRTVEKKHSLIQDKIRANIEKYNFKIQFHETTWVLKQEVDGYDVIAFDKPGFWTAESLRVIADYLDERNEPWDEMIREGICPDCGYAKEMFKECENCGERDL